uniref:NADH:ubiquinone oxidoreductase subunit B2 n=1 Tax=Sciurus vulgaris TaxID=55149 RepID=A0A8D2CSJ1_SCIVU
MSALARLAPFARGGGRLFRGCGARAGGDSGVRQARNTDHKCTGHFTLLWAIYKSLPLQAEMLLPSLGISNPSQSNSRMCWGQYIDFWGW